MHMHTDLSYVYICFKTTYLTYGKKKKLQHPFCQNSASRSSLKLTRLPCGKSIFFQAETKATYSCFNASCKYSFLANVLLPLYMTKFSEQHLHRRPNYCGLASFEFVNICQHGMYSSDMPRGWT